MSMSVCWVCVVLVRSCDGRTNSIVENGCVLGYLSFLCEIVAGLYFQCMSLMYVCVNAQLSTNSEAV